MAEEKAHSRLASLCLSGCFSTLWCGVARPSFPKTMREFRRIRQRRSLQHYLAACRWPDGFACPRCGHHRAYRLRRHRRWQCATCRCQVSLTANTILHNTKTPLTAWFWAAYLVTRHARYFGATAPAAARPATIRNGVDDASQIPARNGQSGTQWLRGEVEVDETWVGGTQAGLRGSRL